MQSDVSADPCMGYYEKNWGTNPQWMAQEFARDSLRVQSVASREIPVIEGVQGGFTRAKDGKLGITLVLARSVVPLCARPRCCCSCSLSFASS